MDNKALFKLSYGLFVLTAKDDKKTSGCIINTAMQAASLPNQMAISVNKTNFTHDLIQKTKEFNISVLSQKADFSLFKHFGFQSGRDTDKFADFSDYKMAANGIPIITVGTNAFFSVKVTATVDLGSHTMFLGEITDMEVLDTVPSATYEYYHANIKPKPAAVKKEKTVWRCTICGYEYEGETLPDDFVCPLCNHPASDFEKVE